MKHLRVLVMVGVVALLLGGCATHKMHVVTKEDRPAKSGNVVHKIFLVGDAGEASSAQTANLDQMVEQLNAFGGEATVLYLGDNIYPEGLPPSKDTFPRIPLKHARKSRDTAEAALRPQIQAVLRANADVRGYFVAGNHDWKKGKAGGLKAIRRQEKFIRENGDDRVRMLPGKGCPGPEVIEIGDHIAMLLIDSQWWLHNWSRENDINEDCEVQSRLDFLTAFGDAVKDNREKQIIVVMHHPLISSGPHGGYFGWRDHLFPFTQVKRWGIIPLPFIYPVLRGTFGNVQDIVHHKYDDLKKGIRAALQSYNKRAIIVSGHEHVLEHHIYRNDHYLVSGSGARHPNKIGKPRTMRFGHGAYGYMLLDVLESGAINLSVYEPGEHQKTPVYSTNLIARAPGTMPLPDLPPAESISDSTVAFISDDYQKQGVYRTFFGERYRALYNQPVKMRNINLSTERGGLTPVKKGGGFQTNSLRLEDAAGKEFVLRGLQKDATRLLPEVFQSTFAMDILQDQFTASHPYAAFVIPKMASAAGIYHTNPELVFLPSQEGLGRFNDAFADGLYLYEERPDGDWSAFPSFGRSDDLISYSDMIEETKEKYTNRVDQEFVLRSRLFDMLIGDWDRHDDQWRWATIEPEDGEGKLFRPVPRDRDQAFSTYDGFIVRLANWYTPSLRKMSVFSDEIKRIKWFNFNARYFDRDFLNQLTRDQWTAIARDLQSRLTDEVIEESLGSWPPEIYAVQGDYILETLKQRRDKLVEFAERYYDVLVETIMIRGTEDADYIQVTRQEGSTRVRVYDSNREGDKNALYYDRTFYNGETKNIQIYGLAGRDHFVVDGPETGGIKVNLVGGEGRDVFNEEGGINRKKLLAQDTHDPARNSSAIRYLEVVEDKDNAYDRLSFEYDYGIPLLVLGGNPDDGFLFGGGIQVVNHGFKKEPFASRHSLSAFYATGSGSYGFEYLGEWSEVLGNAGAGVSAKYLTPSYTQNFFGLGNDSEELVDDIDFYRVRKRNYTIVPFIRFGDDEGHSASLHAGLESHQVERTSGRFISDPDNGLPESAFEEQTFGVARFDYMFQIVDHPMLTRRGFKLHTSFGVDREFSLQNTHQYFTASMTMYYHFKYLGKPVIATRVGTELHGGEFQFYQGAMLGSQSNFRGVPKERFVGKKSFYHNTDIRFRLSQLKSYYLPSAFGVVLSFDHGRVWLEDDNSETWHYAYGGGVWFSPFQTLLLSLNYHVSDIDKRFSVGMGFFF